MNDLKDTLKERTDSYGGIACNAETTESLVAILRDLPGYSKLSNTHKYVYYNILQKITRSICGNPMHRDNLHDIAGYATLLEQYIEAEEDVAEPKTNFLEEVLGITPKQKEAELQQKEADRQHAKLKSLVDRIFKWNEERGISYETYTTEESQELYDEEWQELRKVFITKLSDTYKIEVLDAIGDILFLRVGQYMRVFQGVEETILSLDIFIRGLHNYLRHTIIVTDSEIFDFYTGILECVVESNETKSTRKIPQGNKYSCDGKGENYESPSHKLTLLDKLYVWDVVTYAYTTDPEYSWVTEVCD